MISIFRKVGHFSRGSRCWIRLEESRPAGSNEPDKLIWRYLISVVHLHSYLEGEVVF